jgi:YVTN family beta-propeller protein
VWVTVRGENYVSVLDVANYKGTTRIILPNGPEMPTFSPDGKYGYVCSSCNPETEVVSLANHTVIATVQQASPFCPNIAATPDGLQVWFTLKDIGKTQVFDAHPPFSILKTLDTGPITNHVNIVRNTHGQFAYVTVGGLNEVQVFRTSDFVKVATIPVGRLPHGIWPSGDGSPVYVGLENDDQMVAIDTLTNKVIATVPIGQAPQAVNYVPNAIPEGTGTEGLEPLGIAGQAAHLSLSPVRTTAAIGTEAPRHRGTEAPRHRGTEAPRHRPAWPFSIKAWCRYFRQLPPALSRSSRMFSVCRAALTVRGEFSHWLAL